MSERDEEIKRKLKVLRLMVSGSAALPVKSFDRWKEITGHTLLERYGMTEIGMGITNPYQGERTPGFVGYPFPNVQTTFRDLETDELHSDHDREGELFIKSDTMFDRYYNNEDATADSFHIDAESNRWFKTGDCAISVSEQEGAFKILGRLSQDIIKKQGYKISALELESTMSQHESVNECAVISVPHPEFDEEIVAFVVLKAGSVLSEAEAQKSLN